jgi:predicted small lipoprotein YifL
MLVSAHFALLSKAGCGRDLPLADPQEDKLASFSSPVVAQCLCLPREDTIKAA